MKSPRELQAIAQILGGVPILGVLRDSPAERAGLRYGDIVTHVNGRATASFGEFLAAHDKSSGLLELEVFRDGERLSVEMVLRARQAPAAEIPAAPCPRSAHQTFSEACASHKLS
jgi:S1-C subfamily serine protease